MQYLFININKIDKMEDKLKEEENEEYEQFEIMKEEDNSNNHFHKKKLKSF